MKLFLLVLTSLISGVLSIKFQEELLTEDYLVYPLFEPDSFVQVSQDLVKGKSIGRPRAVSSVKGIKIKHVGPTIHLYWFDYKRGGIQLTKASRNAKEETSPINVPSEAEINDIDIHPTLDLIFVATDEELFQINLATSEAKKLVEGYIRLVKYNAKSNTVYFVDCSKLNDRKMKKFNLSSNDVKGYDLDKCYSAWDMDCESDLLYLAFRSELFKTSLSNVEKFDRNSKENLETTHIRRRSKKPITSLALGSKYLYFATDGDMKFFKVLRDNGNDEKDAITFKGYTFALAIYEGPELEKDPVVADPNGNVPELADPKKIEPEVTDPKEKLPEIADPKGKEPEVTDPKEKVPEIGDPKEKVPEIGDPKEKVPEVGDPKENVPEISDPKEKVPEVTDPKEKIPELGDPKGKVPEVADPKEKVPEVGDPKEKVPEISDPKEKVPEVTDPKEKAPEVGDPKEKVPEVTDPKENVPEIIDPKEKVPEVTDPKEKIPEVTDPKEKVPEVGDPKEKVPEVTDPKENVPEISDPKEKVPEVTDPKEKIPEVTDPKKKVPEVGDPKEKVPEVTDPKEKVPKVGDPKEKVPEIADPNETIPGISDLKEKGLDMFNKVYPKVKLSEIIPGLNSGSASIGTVIVPIIFNFIANRISNNYE